MDSTKGTKRTSQVEMRLRLEERQKGSHKNWMSGFSYDIKDPILKLRVAASSCFFGEPQFYHVDPDDPRPRRKSPAGAEGARKQLGGVGLRHLQETLGAIEPEEWRGATPSQILESAIDAALDHDPEATLKEAVRLRQDVFMRTTPSVILVRAANHPKLKGTGLVRKYARKIIDRVDEIPNSLAYHLATYAGERAGGRRPIPMSLLRSYDDAFHRFSATQLAKYRMEGREVTLVDAVNLTYGLKKAWSEHADELTNPRIPESVKALIRGKLKVTGKTWEAVVSAEGSTKKSWEKSVEKMGHMALLRNVRNLLENKVDPELFVPKLVETAPDGKQMPFRYLSAYEEVRKVKAPARVLDAIEECLEISVGNLPRFPGRTAVLTDNSGSARGAFTSSMGTMCVGKIGNLMGVLTGKASDEGVLGVFGDRLEFMEIRDKSSIFDQVEKAEGIAAGIGGGTEHGIWLFFDSAIRDREHYDVIFVYSDMQAGHGGLYGTSDRLYEDFRWMNSNMIDVPLLIDTYRERVNPNVDVFLVQISGGVDTLIDEDGKTKRRGNLIMPEWYYKTYILGGWSPEVLRFAAEMREIIK